MVVALKGNAHASFRFLDCLGGRRVKAQSFRGFFEVNGDDETFVREASGLAKSACAASCLAFCKLGVRRL
jgi:hypothetical protein